MIIGSGHSQQVVPLKPIYNALNDLKASALPGLHACTWADQTGKFARKSKLTCWKIFQKANENVLDAFTSLGKSHKLSDATITGIEQYVCQLYIPGTQITETGPLHWNLFSKKQAEAEKLPPTHGALVAKIMRAHYQAMVWWHDNVPQPEIPVPTEYGWKEENDELLPVPSKEKPAPDAILQLVKCGCKKSSCMSSLCSCVQNNLVSTEMCFCGADDDICQITELCLQTYESDDNDDEDSSV